MWTGNVLMHDLLENCQHDFTKPISVVSNQSFKLKMSFLSILDSLILFILYKNVRQMNFSIY